MSNSTTWRKYGSARNNEVQNTINTTYLSTENFNMQEPFQGTFRISGDISVNDINASSALFLNDIHVLGTVYSNNLNINDVTANGNLYVDKNAFITQKLYMDVDKNPNYTTRAFLIGNTGKIGINTDMPTATLDICGNISQVLRVVSGQENTRNIIAQNANSYGVSVSANSSVSQLQFFGNGDTNIQSSLQYSSVNGVLQVNAPNNTYINSGLSIGGSSHLLNENLIVHGNNAHSILPNIYLKPSAGTSNTLTLVAGNSTSTTYMNIVSTTGNGLSLGGGAYPVDLSRSLESLVSRIIHPHNYLCLEITLVKTHPLSVLIPMNPIQKLMCWISMDQCTLDMVKSTKHLRPTLK